MVEDADFNNDTAVSGSDFLIWQRNVGRTSGVGNTTGDANGDNLVNGADLAIWQAQYGSTIPVALTVTSGFAVVNEPTSPFQSEPTGSQLTGVTALFYSSSVSDTALNKDVFAEETTELLLVKSAVDTPEETVWSEYSAKDEALATFGYQDAEEYPSEEDIVALLVANTVGQAV